MDWKKKIEVFEGGYTYDTPQERELALERFAKQVEEETAQAIYWELAGHLLTSNETEKIKKKWGVK